MQINRITLTTFTLAALVLLSCSAVVVLAQSESAKPSDSPSARNPAQPVQVSNEEMLGRVEHKSMPVYPVEAMKKAIQGDVIFKIEVDETGRITSSQAIDGNALLVAASKSALESFRFHPYLVEGTAVKVQSKLGFHFAVVKTVDGANGNVECIASLPVRD